MEEIDTIQCLKEKKIKKEKIEKYRYNNRSEEEENKKRECDRNQYHTMIKLC